MATEGSNLGFSSYRQAEQLQFFKKKKKKLHTKLSTIQKLKHIHLIIVSHTHGRLVVLINFTSTSEHNNNAQVVVPSLQWSSSHQPATHTEVCIQHKDTAEPEDQPVDLQGVGKNPRKLSFLESPPLSIPARPFTFSCWQTET